jgi:hypothetical protein
MNNNLISRIRYATISLSKYFSHLKDNPMAEDTVVTEETPEVPTFGIQDLVFTLQILEACAQRGAFRADEMSNVGTVYDRLKAFLTANGAISAPAAQDVTTGE